MNFVNSDDFRSLGRAFGKGIGKLRKLVQSTAAIDRVSDHWNAMTLDADSWYSIPAVQQRWNRLISGNERMDHRDWTAEHILNGETGLNMLSPGCGTGHAEIAWAKTGLFSRIDGWDISDVRLEMARKSAFSEGVNGITHFENRDLLKAEVPDAQYDVILFEHALHHFSPVEDVLQRVHKWLKPGGWLIINEYVGPDRFQWSDNQLREINSLLKKIPESCRKLPDGSIRTRILAPSLLRMWLTDPSEAADASSILPEIRNRFAPVDEKPWGGAILHPLLHQISRHFRDETAGCSETGGCDETLQKLFDREDALMESGVIGSDFWFGVYRKS